MAGLWLSRKAGAVVVSLSLFAAGWVHADWDVPEFPEPAGDRARDGVLLQLAVSKRDLVFGERIQAYVRFLNVGERPLLIGLVDQWPLSARFDRVGAWTGYFWLGDEVGAALCGAVCLDGGETLVMRLRDCLLRPGTHALSVKYLAEFPGKKPGQRPGLWVGEVPSNIVTVRVRETMLSGERRRVLEDELVEKVKQIETVGANWYDYLGLMTDAMPYSHSALRYALESDEPRARHMAAWVVGDMANKTWVEAMGLTRDTTLFPELLESMEKQVEVLGGADQIRWTEEEALSTMLSACREFMDTMTRDERGRLRKVMRRGLALHSRMLRGKFAAEYLQLFPAEAVRVVGEKFEDPGFWVEEPDLSWPDGPVTLSRSTLEDKLEETKAEVEERREGCKAVFWKLLLWLLLVIL